MGTSTEVRDPPRHCPTSRLCIGFPTATSLVLGTPFRALTGDQRKRPRRKTLKGAQRALGPPRGPCPYHTPEARKSALLILLSLIRATSLPGSAPQAPGHAVARDHALLPSRDGRFVARARRT